MFPTLFSSAYLSSSTGGSGGLAGPGVSTDKSIPRWVGFSGNILDSSGIIISDNSDIVIRNSNASSIQMALVGTASGVTDPEYRLGNIGVQSGEAFYSFSYKDASLVERTIANFNSSGWLELVRQGFGKFISGTYPGRTNPVFKIEGSSLLFSDESTDILPDAGVSRSSTNRLSILSGVLLVETAYATPGQFGLGPSTSLRFPALASSPVPPSSGFLMYPRTDGLFYYLDSLGIERQLTSPPVITFDAGYRLSQGNGFLRTVDGIFTNISPFVAPFDCRLIAITMVCEQAVNEWRAQVFISPNPVPSAEAVCLAAQSLEVDDSFSLDLNKEDKISVYLRKGPGGNGAGPNIPTPKVQLFLIRR
jgi:hypothetical protein